MTTITISRVNALPAQAQPNTLYFVKSADGSLVDLHVSNNDGTEVRRIISKGDILSLIALNGGGGGGGGAATQLAFARRIASTGDGTWEVMFDGSSDVSSSFTLSSTGVAAGAYGIVTVDTKGRVTAGRALSATDIPSLDAAKITTGTLSVGTTGNAATATKLATARTINGVAFDGTSNITINSTDAISRIATSEKGAINGVATLDATGKLTASQLPAGANDFIPVANLSTLQASQGTAGKLYVTVDTSKLYYWNGVAYVEASQSTAGGGSSSAPQVVYMQPVRYEINSTAGYKAHCTTSAPVYTGLTWSRVGTNLTVERTGHGKAVGDRVIVKNTNVAMLVSLITSVTANTYTVTCEDTGSTGGSDANYTSGIKFAHNSEVAGALTGGVVTVPLGEDILIHSLRIHTKANSRSGATYDLTLPVSLYNVSMGQDTDTDGLYLPVHQIRGDADTLPAVANTIAVNQAGGGYHTIRFSALGATTQGQLMLLQF